MNQKKPPTQARGVLDAKSDVQLLENAIKIFGSARKVALMSGVSEQNLSAIRKGLRPLPFPLFLLVNAVDEDLDLPLPDMLWLYCLRHETAGQMWRELLASVTELKWSEIKEWVKEREELASRVIPTKSPKN